MPSGTLNRECTYDISLTGPCSTFADWQPRQRPWKRLSWKHCVLMTVPSWRIGSFDLQIIVNESAEASHLFGLTISLGKTEVLFQPAPAAVAHRPTISIDGTQLKIVDNFTYLGTVISADRSLDKEISTWICKASLAHDCLKTCVLSQHNIRRSTKLKVYRAVILNSLLYGCETWTLYRRHLKQLERFHMHSLQTMLNIKWQDCVSNLQVLDMAESTSIEAMILNNWLCWVGHVIRMEDNRQPKQLMFGELASGNRKQGRPQEIQRLRKGQLKSWRNYPQGAWAPRSWQDWMASPHQTRHGHIWGEAPHTDRGGPRKKKGVGWCSRHVPGPASLRSDSTATSVPMADGSNTEESYHRFQWTTTIWWRHWVGKREGEHKRETHILVCVCVCVCARARVCV